MNYVYGFVSFFDYGVDGFVFEQSGVVVDSIDSERLLLFRDELYMYPAMSEVLLTSAPLEYSCFVLSRFSLH